METISYLFEQSWLGIAIGLLGVAIAIYQTVRRTGPRLIFQASGQRLIEAGGGLLPNEVAVQYAGSQVPRVTLSQIVIWNHGAKAVRAEDVVQEDPIVFDFGNDSEVLKAEIVKRSREANKSRLLIEGDQRNILRYKFSFLDRGDGVLIRVLHTGKEPRPKCSGTIIGMPKGMEFGGPLLPSALHALLPALIRAGTFSSISVRTPSKSIVRTFKIFLSLVILVGLGAVMVALFPSLVMQFQLAFQLDPVPISTSDRIGLGVAGTIYSLPFLLLLWLSRRRFPSSLLSDEIDEP
ncbi:hypothetical protein [Pelagibius marinus]|uniref:hypothetical protein n=1 Tax=Pelagibius marinus TaxID=2762760 RepID=UPI001872AEE5|nr:hypothetical protein [Pelagibius marinus]